MNIWIDSHIPSEMNPSSILSDIEGHCFRLTAVRSQVNTCGCILIISIYSKICLCMIFSFIFIRYYTILCAFAKDIIRVDCGVKIAFLEYKNELFMLSMIFINLFLFTII